MFIQPAYAQEVAAAPSAGSPMASMLMIIVMFVVMYFLMIAPQRKRMKEHKALISALKKGDEVMTSSGIMGRIVALDEQAIDLEIAKGTVVRFNRHFVGQVLPKGSLKGELKSDSPQQATTETPEETKPTP